MNKRLEKWKYKFIYHPLNRAFLEREYRKIAEKVFSRSMKMDLTTTNISCNTNINYLDKIE